MQKFFNTTGLCNPEHHYMVDPFRGLYPAVSRLIAKQQFFILHAPRQTGKTTFLHALAHQLNREGRYTAVVSSMESAGYQSITVEGANRLFVRRLYSNAQYFLPEGEWPPQWEPYLDKENSFYNYLVDWASAQAKPIVLLLDEVDALYDDVLISVLRQLRDGFQVRPARFPQSVALVGLRDIREYRVKARGDNPSIGAGSPFNVKAESYFLPVFSEQDVRGLLRQHTDTTGQVFEPQAVADLYEVGGGQPWLTNALAHEIVERMLNDDYSQTITPAMVEEAKERLIARRDTHLDSLMDKLKEPRVRQIVMAVISGNSPAFDDYDDALRYCRDLGIVRLQDGVVRFANPIYQEIITRLLNMPFQHSMVGDDMYQTAWYLRPDGSLDMDKLLQAFQQFYRRHAEGWLNRFEFKEAGQQLLLMAFLQRIVNGGGRIEREMAAGNGRTDLTVFWKNQTLVLELKLKYGDSARDDGLRQIARYMDTLGQQHGYLVLFELKKSDEVPWETRLRWSEENYSGKRVTVVEM
jgi:hypothetical protein